MAAAIQSNQSTVKKCFHCDKAEETAKKILQCAQCSIALYCDKACQKADWKKHKVTCLKEKKEQKASEESAIFCDAYELPKAFLEALKANVKPLELGEHSYKAPHDFGKKVKTLFISTAFPNSSENYVEGIKALSASLGFQVQTSLVAFYARDYFLLLPNGQIVTSPITEIGVQDGLLKSNDPVILADERVFSGSLALNQNVMSFTSHPFFQRPFGATAYCQKGHCKDLLKLLGTGRVFQTPFYFEGGNIFFATNKLGNVICLMGKESFNLIHMEMRLKGAFKKGSDLWGAQKVTEKLPQMMQEIREVLAKRFADDLKPIAAEMYFKGLLKGKSGLLPRDEAYDIAKESGPRGRGFFSEIALNKGWVKYPEFTKDELSDPSLIDYVVERSVLMDKVIPYFLAVENPICIVAQCGYHLDTFIQPGPCGSLFIQDYSLCYDKLMLIKKSKESLKLTTKDLTILDRYIETAKHLADALEPLYKSARAEIERYKFSVITLPATFYDDGNASPSFHCNFMNGLSGFANGSFYYITGWADVGDNLGAVLMEVFREQLKSIVPGIKVTFIKEGMSLWNRLHSQAGLHCLTTELEVIASSQ